MAVFSGYKFSYSLAVMIIGPKLIGKNCFKFSYSLAVMIIGPKLIGKNCFKFCG